MFLCLVSLHKSSRWGSSYGKSLRSGMALQEGQWSTRLFPTHNLNLFASGSHFPITAPEAETRAAHSPWSHQNPSTERTAVAGRGSDCLPAGMLPPYHACAHPPRPAPAPIPGLHLPVLKVIIVIYCPSKGKTQFFHFCLVLQGSSTLFLLQLSSSQTSLFSWMGVQRNWRVGTGRSCSLPNV